MKTQTNGPKRPLPSSELNATKTMRSLGERATMATELTWTDNQEPVRWITTADTQRPGGYRGNHHARTATGKVARMPAVAHRADSDYRNRVVDERTRSRFRTMIDHHGHTVFHCHSNAAAHVPMIQDGRFSTDGYAAHAIRKAHAFGWIDIHAGCLKRQVAAGLVNPAKLLVDIGTAKVCAKDAATCKHITSEQQARQAANAKRMQAIEDAAKRNDPSVAMAVAVARALKEQSHG
jgi:hypothetical protein